MFISEFLFCLRSQYALFCWFSYDAVSIEALKKGNIFINVNNNALTIITELIITEKNIQVKFSQHLC